MVFGLLLSVSRIVRLAAGLVLVMHTMASFLSFFNFLQGSTVNMNSNQKFFDHTFSFISPKTHRLGVVLFIGKYSSRQQGLKVTFCWALNRINSALGHEACFARSFKNANVQ